MAARWIAPAWSATGFAAPGGSDRWMIRMTAMWVTGTACAWPRCVSPDDRRVFPEAKTMIPLRPLALAALAVALATAAHARLGDTLAEATQRYGAATERTATVPATLSRGFTRGGLTIEADFIKDSVHRMTYRRASEFPEEEIQELLAENAGSYSWLPQSNRLNPLREASGQRVWLRSDRGSATLTRHTDGKAVSENLVLTDGVWLMASLKLTLELNPVPATTNATQAAAQEIPFQVRAASDVTVVIRNNTSDNAAAVNPPRAIALRRVEWAGGPADSRRWHGPVVGAVTENPDHTLTLNPNIRQLPSLFFERGLLLPGDEITVDIPLAPRGAEPPVLKITYAWAGDSSQWGDGVLLLLEGERGLARFAPATPDRVEARHHRGGMGALRGPLATAAAPAVEQTCAVPVKLPLAPDPATGKAP